MHPIHAAPVFCFFRCLLFYNSQLLFPSRLSCTSRCCTLCVILSLRTSAGNQPGLAARLDAYSMLSIGANCGAAIGPFLGSIVASRTPAFLGIIVCLPLAIGYMCQAKLPIPIVPELRDANDKHELSQTNWSIAIATIVAGTGTWFAFSQVFVVLATSLHSTGQSSWAPWLYSLNSLIVVVFQRAVTRRLSSMEEEGKVSTNFGLIIGNVLITLSLVGFYVGTGSSIAICLISIVFFTFGEMAWDPVFERQIAATCGTTSRPYVLGLISVARGSPSPWVLQSVWQMSRLRLVHSSWALHQV